MPRPHKTRRIYGEFEADYFKPRGRMMSELEEIHLEADEIEAVRLADLKCQYQNDAAAMMGISRQTFGNIIKRAHQKVADALINGKAIRFTPVVSERMRCRGCGQRWAETAYVSPIENCPVCESTAIETEILHFPGHGQGRRGNQ
ncbi:MAG: DUF134 domain-containing protein [Candidatus Marinimicrobia bacterium]|nr:DUF134 domain-containing protein [Candidatus Neomarinimicrobiota bacterium]